MADPGSHNNRRPGIPADDQVLQARKYLASARQFARNSGPAVVVRAGIGHGGRRLLQIPPGDFERAGIKPQRAQIRVGDQLVGRGIVAWFDVLIKCAHGAFEQGGALAQGGGMVAIMIAGIRVVTTRIGV